MMFSESDQEELRENVARGVAWFEETDPHWRDRIRETISVASPFNMKHCEMCAISRFFRTGYYTALEQICVGMDDYEQTQWGRELGFDLPNRFHEPGCSNVENTQAWQFLQELWLVELHME